jgi:hypothetical protein
MVRRVPAAIVGTVSDVLGMGVRELPVAPEHLLRLVRTRPRTAGGGLTACPGTALRSE